MPGRTLDVQPGSFFASSETMAAGNASNFHPVLPSRYVAQCHSREKEMTSVVDAFFLRNWPFPDERSRKKFLAAGFSRVTCYYFPMARHDRIEHACMLLTILFLVDGEWSADHEPSIKASNRVRPFRLETTRN